VGTLIVAMVALVFYGVLGLRRMQERYDNFHPEKVKDKDK
jgi:multisubunit Na+/H+ antiporter MnhG subunit